MKTTHSLDQYEKALRFIPGGVNSPVRAFGGVGGTPLFFKRAQGAYLYDEDDNAYIDYIGSWGPHILGHGHPDVINAIIEQVKAGLSFGAPTALETQMAQLLCQLVPSMERVRLVNSGTEATMSAIRLARAFTKRNKIIKFAGCYHGHSDAFLVSAGSGALTCGSPSSPGVPPTVVENTLLADFNDLAQVESLFSHYPDDIAAIIVEPIAGNMNCILPVPEFLSGLRALCDQHKTILIFDEVMTGFRVALGGAQALYDVKPDMTTLGKVIGAGLPVGAFGGRADIMCLLAPEGPVYQAGTLSGNPVALAGGLAALTLIQTPGFYDQLGEKTARLMREMQLLAHQSDIPFTSVSVGGMFGFFFTELSSVNSLEQAKQCNLQRFQAFYHAALAQGIYFAPSMYEAGFTSSAHTDEVIDKTLIGVKKALSLL